MTVHNRLKQDSNNLIEKLTVQMNINSNPGSPLMTTGSNADLNSSSSSNSSDSGHESSDDGGNSHNSNTNSNLISLLNLPLEVNSQNEQEHVYGLITQSSRAHSKKLKKKFRKVVNNSSSSSSSLSLPCHSPSHNTLSNNEDLLETNSQEDEGEGGSQDYDLLGRILAEFDGTTVLCRVCGDKASGFHYGVHSCEGCKGFFRRSIQQKIQYRPCTKNQQCSILRVNRNRCQYCRLKKCIAVGMSRDAVRFGRVPKREKAKILAAMQQSHHAKSAERALTCELEDLSKLTSTIIQAHIDTCEFTREKVKVLYQKANYNATKDGDHQSTLPIPTLACPLNPHPHSAISDFSERFSPAIRGVVEFAKRLPGFSILSQDDQVTLLKAGVFEILLVRLACMFEGNSMLCINGQILERDTVSAQNARFLLDSMFKFAEQFNKIGLNDEQIGMFCAMVVIAPDRPGLRNVELVTKLQSHIRSSMSSMIAPFKVQELERKIPDLRTLNTLHSEKLLAFKMEESQSSSSENAANSCANNTSSASSPCSSQQQQQRMSPINISQPLSVSSHRSSKSSEDAEILSSDDSHHELNHSFSSPSTSPLRSEKMCPYSMGSTKYPGISSSSSSSGIESPSGDSGIESGACCSPARSEQDSLIVNLGQNNSSTQEEMPVLKRALQAPPMVDTNLLMNEAYRPHKKFRYTSSTSSSTYSSSSSTSPSGMSTPSRLESPIGCPESMIPEKCEMRGGNNTPAPAHQLYPQLASALTQPKLCSSLSNSSSSSSSSGSSLKSNCLSSSSSPSSGVHSSRLMNPNFKSPLSMTHSTLAKTLNEKPKMLSQESALASDLLHTLIMRGGPMEQCVSMDPLTRNISPKSLHQQHNQMYTYTKMSRDNSQATSNFFDNNMLVTTNSIHNQAANSIGPLNLSKKVL